MLILVCVLAAWSAVILLVLGMCAEAAAGDRVLELVVDDEAPLIPMGRFSRYERLSPSAYDIARSKLSAP